MGNRSIIHLECVSCRKNNMPGVSRYAATKNKKKTTKRLQFNKYCRFERRHTLHRETK